MSRESGGSVPSLGRSAAGCDPAESALCTACPEAGSEDLLRLRRAVLLLRLLADDARSSGGERVAWSVARARGELETDRDRRARSALDELLRHHLWLVLGAGTFLRLPPPGGSFAAAWRAVDALHEEGLAALPTYPLPGTGERRIVGQLLDALSAVGAPAPAVRLWRARFALAFEEPAAALALWQELVDGEDPTLDGGPEVAQARQGLVAAWLEAGRVREALAWMTGRPGLLATDPELAWYAVWATLLAGELETARSRRRGLAPWSGPLPGPLAELRDRRPDWGDLLPGRRPDEPGGPPRGERAWLRGGSLEELRRALGARLLGLLVWRERAAPGLEALAVAPGRREETELRYRARGRGGWDGAELEQRLLATHEDVLLHLAGGRPAAPEVLSGDGVLGLAALALRDAEGELAGWLQVELEHHALPRESWRRALVRRFQAEVVRRAAPPEGPPAGTTGDPSREGHEALRLCLGPWLEQTVPVSRRRRAHLFLPVRDARGGETWLSVLSTGDALRDFPVRPGLGRAVERVRRGAAAVVWDEPDRRLSLHAEAASGVALPVRTGERLRAIVVVEATRRREFPRREVERLAVRIARAAPALQLARFRAWHLEHTGVPLHLSPSAPVASCWDVAARAARQRTPLVLTGEPGVGRGCVASGYVFELGPLPPDGAREGTPLLVRDVERLQGAELERLAGRIEDPGEGPFVLTTSEEALPRVRARLLRGRASLVVHVPSLRERRDEVPALVACLAGRCAAEAEALPVRFADDALALLFRQPWPGNIPELASVVRRCALEGPGRTLDGAELAELARRARWRFQERLPSRRPRASDVLAALRLTRRHGGALNRTRAAFFLGWDRDTLATRLRERPELEREAREGGGSSSARSGVEGGE